MSPTRFSWIAGCLILAAAGCRMCAHPYDECGPTFFGGHPAQCMSTARAGSILSGRIALSEEQGWPAEAGEVPGQAGPVIDTEVDQPPEPAQPGVEISSPQPGGWRPASKPVKGPPKPTAANGP
ncbi:MAG: hypothetical protein ACUVUC_15520 [Thermoguttaceae bacterium]